MDLDLPVGPKRRKIKRDFVLVCAWCNQQQYKPLQKNQEYAHGICEAHKIELLQGTSFKFALKSISYERRGNL